MAKKQKVYKKYATATFSKIVRSYGRCEAEGYEGKACSPKLDCAHIISRRYSATRTDFRNAYCLCFTHHRYFHDYPRSFSRFVTDTWAQSKYDDIYAASITPTKVDWQDRLAYLKTIELRIQDGKITLAELRGYDY